MKKPAKPPKPRTTEKDTKTNIGLKVSTRNPKAARAKRGDIVTYRDGDGQDWPAIITDIFEDRIADLVVFGMILTHGPQAAMVIQHAPHGPAELASWF